MNASAPLAMRFQRNTANPLACSAVTLKFLRAQTIFVWFAFLPGHQLTGQSYRLPFELLLANWCLGLFAPRSFRKIPRAIQCNGIRP